MAMYKARVAQRYILEDMTVDTSTLSPAKHAGFEDKVFPLPSRMHLVLIENEGL